MNSIKDEIIQNLDSSIPGWDWSSTVDEIIKIFEKRIDCKIHNVECDYSSSKENFQINQRRLSQIQILKELKKEILNESN